jgi:hypothetical protein
VGQRPAQPDPERLGQVLGVGVPGAQEGVEVLLRVARGVGRGLLAGVGLVGHPAVAGQRAQVGEDLQDLGLAVQLPGVTGGQRGPRRRQAVQELARLVLADVEAEHQRAQGGQRVGHGHGLVWPGHRAQRGQVGPLARLRLPAVPDGVLARVWFDPDQLGARLDLRVDVGEDLGDPA